MDAQRIDRTDRFLTAGQRHPKVVSAMYAFFVTVHACPAVAVAGPTLELEGRSLQTLRIAPDALAATTFDCSFEAAREQLSRLERMFCEPDGSFVWVSSREETPWQIDGNLYDHNERLLFVDLKGCCPREAFDRLLMALGWPGTKLMFQLTREAIFLDEAEFRRLAEARGSA
jgi:hypothetical protein